MRYVGLPNLTTLVASLLLVNWAAPVGAAAVEDLWGTLSLREISTVGETEIALPTFDAVHTIPETSGGLTASWTLHATNVVVNLTHSKKIGLSSSPSNPDRPISEHETALGSSERTFVNANLSSRILGETDAGLLLRAATDGASLESRSSSSVSAGSAGRAVWRVGRHNDATVNATVPDVADPLDRFHATRPGHLQFSSTSEVRWVAKGDLIMTVWGAEVTVTDGHGVAREYRSGRWDDNQSVAMRDRYEQLVELRVTNGTLTWNHEQGRAQWTAREGSVETTGTVTFESARGRLESATRLYEPDGERLQIVGRVIQGLSSGGASPDQLSSQLQAEHAWVNREPDGVIAPAPNSNHFLGVDGWSLLAWLTVGIGGTGTAVWVARRWLPPKDGKAEVERAEQAMVRQQFGQAVHHARRALGLDSRNVAAWFVLGAARLEQQRFCEVEPEIRQAMKDLGQPGAFAFLFGLAHDRAGQKTEAGRWFRQALQDPGFAKDARESPDLRELLEALGLKFPNRSETGYV